MDKIKQALFYAGLFITILNSLVLSDSLSIVVTTLGVALILYGGESVNLK
ncbi:hypothetical protein [Lactobacillus xylocopicola]|uniref:DUF1056 domain-containing protein n=1 Tax=Lactobacillus xylocopicola TaxID=2976676 RepID=A0ABN6SKS6_9LACO|nr:hypothetical protein [Lactobacillus xylocopicola]BDR60258.1 hypothetical protein KIM322_05190 [Lactobacillus xylocopicola]